MPEKRATRPTFGQIQRLAAPWGVLDLGRLRAAGLSDDGISWRVRKRRLYRLHRGVYSVIAPEHLAPQGRWLAAVYACGAGAALSHLAAAALWELMRPPSGPIDVTVPSGSGRRKRAGIRIHRSRSLNDATVTIREGIAVTTPARTLADLRGSVPPSVHRAIRRQAEIRRYDLGPDTGPPVPPWTGSSTACLRCAGATASRRLEPRWWSAPTPSTSSGSTPGW